MRDGDKKNGSNSHNRRQFLTRGAGAVAATGMFGLAGCIGGGGGGGDDTVQVGGIHDLSGATSDVGQPTGRGTRDALEWVNENEDLSFEINHDWVDYAYDVPNAQNHYNSLTSGDNPPVIIGWGTADTEALASEVARDEIVYVSASYSDKLLDTETPYNFFVNLDYTSQGRAHAEWIANNDSGATVAMIHNTTPFGESPVSGTEAYAEELGLNVSDNITLELGANTADTQVERAMDNDVDYLIHQNTAAPMQVLMSSVSDLGADITVMGLTWTVDEFRAQTAADAFEGVRYVNTNKSWNQVESESPDGWQIIQDSFEREGHDMSDPEIANINYVRGVAHALLAVEALQRVDDDGGDIQSGPAVREKLIEMDEFDARGLLPTTLNYQEEDRRATMLGQTYEVNDGEMVPDQEIELPRRTEWLP
ncbi:ABC transporter substrate-binding protein [Halovenus salina]|uniref:ABC transporter substrate-binding protein n=1 Tax=Halovenus salina TaxID=1510225 RepID=A0ABD5VXX1_9EURY|nr:ABC transporter substrate-binding protein [Halovenus salina]